MHCYLLPAVGSGQVSVRNGEAGRPESFVRFGWRGLLLKAYRTAFGLGTAADETSTLSRPIIFASAQTHFLSSPAIANSSRRSPSLIRRPLPTSSKVSTIFEPWTSTFFRTGEAVILRP